MTNSRAIYEGERFTWLDHLSIDGRVIVLGRNSPGYFLFLATSTELVGNTYLFPDGRVAKWSPDGYFSTKEEAMAMAESMADNRSTPEYDEYDQMEE